MCQRLHIILNMQEYIMITTQNYFKYAMVYNNHCILLLIKYEREMT